MSIWLPCGPGYEASLEGDIRRSSTGRILKGYITQKGYKEVHIYVGQCQQRVNRLVAQAFLPAPTEEGLVVDHIDRNKLNNHASNLRWVSQVINRANRDPYIRPQKNNILNLQYISPHRNGKDCYDIRFKHNGQSYRKYVIGTLEEVIAKRDEMLAECGIIISS